MPTEDELREQIADLRRRKHDSKRLIKKLTDEQAPKGSKLAFRQFKASLRNVSEGAKRRIPILKAKLKAKQDGGAKDAVAWARKKIGTTESPAGSNWGPEIGEWIKYTGYSGPVYWCGCFVCYAVVNIGGANIPNRIRLGYHLNIVADAKAGVNGLKAWAAF